MSAGCEAPGSARGRRKHGNRLRRHLDGDEQICWKEVIVSGLVNDAKQGSPGRQLLKATAGAGAEEVLLEPSDTFTFRGLTSWSRDGRFLLLDVNAHGGDVWVVPVGGNAKPYPLLNGNSVERLAYFSPDDRWVAYQSNENNRAEIYLRPFSASGGKWQVSVGGGAQPRWRHDGKELYFIAPDAKLMASSISVNGNSIERSQPVALLQTRIFLGVAENPVRGQYNVAPDGHFLINTVIDDAVTPPITILQNWRPE